MYCFRQYIITRYPFIRPKVQVRRATKSYKFFSSSSTQHAFRQGLRPTNMGRTLWRYFNAPGNVVFVTTNVVTLVGMMSYTTLQGIARERALQDYMQSRAWEGEIDEPAVAEIGPIRKYLENEILLPSNKPPSTCHMQHAKMSLFHLLYSFYICQQMACKDVKKDSGEWCEELKSLRNGLPKERFYYPQPLVFYRAWRAEFDEIFLNLNRSQQFHMPNWRLYPTSLQTVCQSLYDNDLRTIPDFMNFYKSVQHSSLKTILRAWLYDNIQLFQITKESDNEVLYRNLVHACYNDDWLFSQYASIILNPENPRRKAFFNQHSHHASVSLATVLEVLKGNVLAATDTLDNAKYHDSILKLVSLIRTNCFLACSQDVNEGASEVRILLPTESESGEPLSNPSKLSADRSECYRLVSENSEAMDILGAISKLRDQY